VPGIPAARVTKERSQNPVDDAQPIRPSTNACSENRALVFADGHLAGIVSPADISRALERISGNSSTFASDGR
jgi:hypothetical protein